MIECENRDSFESEVLKTEGMAIADFYSETCVPCKRMSPILEELERDCGGSVKFAKVNVGIGGELAAEYGVEAVPTIIFFRDGEEVSRTVGLTQKSELAAVIDDIRREQ